MGNRIYDGKWDINLIVIVDSPVPVIVGYSLCSTNERQWNRSNWGFPKLRLSQIGPIRLVWYIKNTQLLAKVRSVVIWCLQKHNEKLGHFSIIM